jgi:hypothetical protein
VTKPDEFQYDVFLSHSARDKAVVRPLAERLRQDGLKVSFDDWGAQALGGTISAMPISELVSATPKRLGVACSFAEGGRVLSRRFTVFLKI